MFQPAWRHASVTDRSCSAPCWTTIYCVCLCADHIFIDSLKEKVTKSHTYILHSTVKPCILLSECFNIWPTLKVGLFECKFFQNHLMWHLSTPAVSHGQVCHIEISLGLLPQDLPRPTATKLFPLWTSLVAKIGPLHVLLLLAES